MKEIDNLNEEISVILRNGKLGKHSKELKKKIQKRIEELKEKVNELERLNKLAIGRELKMVELKKEVTKLHKELGKEV